ncbi:MFS transporter [uncultured Nocardioides sp.]|uniref:MFS transporter n=1 Tax=uncultured Nocardioides sp. TaxID=198441 RepID=UPI0030FAC65C
MNALTPATAERVFYLLTITRWLPVGLVVAVVGLRPLERGLTISEITTIAALGGVAVLALELPTSGLADAIGRRPLLVVAAVLNVVSSLLFWWAESFAAFAASAVLQGLFRALDSGPLEAWYVDTVHAHRPGVDVTAELSRAGTLLGLAMAVGAVVSGLLVWWDPLPVLGSPLSLPVLLWTVLNAGHLLATIALLREPRRPGRQAGVASAWAGAVQAPRVVVSGLRLALDNRVLGALLLVQAAVGLAMIGFETLVPLRLAGLLGSEASAAALMGPVAAVGWALFAAGAGLGGTLAARLGTARAAALTHALMGAAVLALAAAVGPAGVAAGYLVSYALFGSTAPLHSALVHREAEATNRATVLSLCSMAAVGVYSLTLPLVGLLAGATSLAWAFALLGAATLVGTLAYRSVADAERTRDPVLLSS